jgi:hypothetical protein
MLRLRLIGHAHKLGDMVRGASRNAPVVSDLVTGRKHSPNPSGNSKIRAAAQCHLGLGNRRLLANAGRRAVDTTELKDAVSGAVSLAVSWLGQRLTERSFSPAQTESRYLQPCAATTPTDGMADSTQVGRMGAHLTILSKGDLRRADDIHPGGACSVQ